MHSEEGALNATVVHRTQFDRLPRGPRRLGALGLRIRQERFSGKLLEDGQDFLPGVSLPFEDERAQVRATPKDAIEDLPGLGQDVRTVIVVDEPMASRSERGATGHVDLHHPLEREGVESGQGRVALTLWKTAR